MAETRQRREALGVCSAAAVVLVLVIVTLAASFGPPIAKSGILPAPPGPTGLTFYQAIGLANASAARIPGGPWALTTAQGIGILRITAPPAPLGEPNAAACQALPGPTLWNGSAIPIWTGSLSSGAVPFWSILYLNSTDYVLSIDIENDSAHASASIAPDSPCGGYLNRSLEIWNTGEPSYDRAPWESFDSSVASALAWQAAGKQFVAANTTASIVYDLGRSPTNWVPFGPGWSVAYIDCGSPASTWNRPYAFVGVTNATGPPSIVENGAVGCWSDQYSVSFRNLSALPSSYGGTSVSTKLTFTPDGGVDAWMTTLTIAVGGGAPEAPITVDCANGQLGPGSCHPLGVGWFAALTSETGGWLDLFSNQGGSGNWSIPTTAIYSNDSLIVFLPSSISPATVNLTLDPTYSTIRLAGSTTL
jgi:hypothetical protein